MEKKNRESDEALVWPMTPNECPNFIEIDCVALVDPMGRSPQATMPIANVSTRIKKKRLDCGQNKSIDIDFWRMLLSGDENASATKEKKTRSQNQTRAALLHR